MKKRILMIDDDAHMHRIVKIYLKDAPYELTNVSSARLALHKLSEEAFDLILSDIQMPGMDGIELIRRIKEKFPKLPIIVLSAFDVDEFGLKFNSFQNVKILSKPFDHDSLLKLIKHYLADV